MTKPLDDITIVEIDSWMAAPSGAAILADLGARVIKIEPLSGDPNREMGRRPKVDGPIADHDFQFDVDNRGKESILLDLTQPEAIEIVKKLCVSAQVFLCNLLPVRQTKFGLDPESLKQVNPKLVHATLTGYGTRGPDAWRPGYDVTAFFGRSGISDSPREGDDGIPARPISAQGDHTTGLALVSAILAGLRLAERTGEFQAVETSLYETAVWTQASDFAPTLVDEAPLRKRRRDESLTITANRYLCGDGAWMMLNMPEHHWWPRFCDALGKPELKADDRFTEARDRYRQMATLVSIIDDVILKKDRDEWGRIFDEHGIIWAPLLGIHEVVSDEQAKAIDLFPEINADGVGRYRTVRAPMYFHSVDTMPERSSPQAGQHTVGILSDLGFSAEEISRLKDANVTS
ncbi:MAG: CoA transferase [Gammaproteobacteria bacterium]|nr:CoA transferase [Gammaproteobacteria bacterium]